jgi:hypothetical protein
MAEVDDILQLSSAVLQRRPQQFLLTVLSDVAADGVFEVGDRFEDATSDLSASDDGEEAFDSVEPEC